MASARLEVFPCTGRRNGLRRGTRRRPTRSLHLGRSIAARTTRGACFGRRLTAHSTTRSLSVLPRCRLAYRSSSRSTSRKEKRILWRLVFGESSRPSITVRTVRRFRSSESRFGNARAPALATSRRSSSDRTALDGCRLMPRWLGTTARVEHVRPSRIAAERRHGDRGHVRRRDGRNDFPVQGQCRRLLLVTCAMPAVVYYGPSHDCARRLAIRAAGFVAAVGADAAIALTCSRRHLNNRLALMPPFIAIPATDAPGTRLCAISSSLNARSCCRRLRTDPLV